ncbi:MAG: hypothetical protein GF330_14105 [Candidatus Eisenbacteria bacterium]|nr:hypothetical protein [Candidatus Eisenbacteria bacterium]
MLLYLQPIFLTGLRSSLRTARLLRRMGAEGPGEFLRCAGHAARFIDRPSGGPYCACAANNLGGTTLAMARTAEKREGTILLCLLLAAPLLLTPWVHGDGIGQFVFLRSAVIDGDLDLRNEYDYLTRHITEDAGGLPGSLLSYSEHDPGYHRGYHRPEPDPVTGRVGSNWSIGPALLWAPAYLLAHGVSHLAAAVGLPARTDGYGGLYYWALALTTFACGVAGLLLAFRLARRLVSPRNAHWATLTIAGATSLVYYLYLAPSHSHALTALTASLFLLHWYLHRRSRRPAVWLQWGLLAGLLFLVRWNDIVIAVPPLLLETWRLLRPSSAVGSQAPAEESASASATGWERRLACLGAAAGGFLLIAALQFGVWQHFHGRPWIRHSVATLQFTPAGLWGTLFSWRHGLFTWTPVTLLAAVGWVRLLRRHAELATVSLAIFAALVLSNCTVYDWWAGTAFGMRRLVSLTPLFVLGLAILLEDLQQLWRRRLPWCGAFLAPLVLLLFVGWNLLLLGQFALGMISHVQAVPFSEMLANQPRLIARLLALAREMLG